MALVYGCTPVTQQSPHAVEITKLRNSERFRHRFHSDLRTPQSPYCGLMFNIPLPSRYTPPLGASLGPSSRGSPRWPGGSAPLPHCRKRGDIKHGVDPSVWSKYTILSLLQRLAFFLILKSKLQILYRFWHSFCQEGTGETCGFCCAVILKQGKSSCDIYI